MNTIDLIEREQMRMDLPHLRPGDKLRVHYRIKEGDKVRIQVYEGVMIAQKRGGVRASITAASSLDNAASFDAVAAARFWDKASWGWSVKRWNSVSTFRATPGSICDSPLTTPWMASTRFSLLVSLSR